MQEFGTIISTNGNKAKVLIKRHAACGECGACHVGKEKMTMETTAQNLINARPGEDVLVEMQTMNVLTATGIAYGIPLLAFLLGAIVGWYVAPSLSIDQTLFAFSLGLILTIVAYFFIFLSEKLGYFNFKFQPKITEKAEKTLPIENNTI